MGRHEDRGNGKKRLREWHHYLMVIAYDGSGFNGWQSQQDSGRTVQEELTRVARAVFKQEIKMEGSGRTDAGVHAAGQAVSFSIEGRLRPDKIKRVLNHSLPGDIRVLSVEEKPEGFHARYDAVGKTYLYKIKRREEVNVFDSRYYHYVAKTLDVGRMRAAATYFEGTHDFENFSASNHGKKSTVRTIDEISITEHGESVEIKVSGSGFLWKMVRMIAQTLIDAGIGAIEPLEVKKLFHIKGRRKEAAPACGLYLQEVRYEARRAEDANPKEGNPGF